MKRHPVWHFVLIIGLGTYLLLAMINQASAQIGVGDKTINLPRGPVPDSYIVVFANNVQDPRSLALEKARRNGLALGHVYQWALKGFSATMPAARVADLRNDPDVAYVEQNIYAYISAQTVPTGIMRVDAHLNPTARNNTLSKARAVAVLDTGIDFEHPDLNVNTDLSVNCISNNPFRADCKSGGDDDSFHGTHVAGTIGGLDNDLGVLGVAPGVSLVAVKVLNSQGSGTTASILAGIDYITANAGQMAVANLSLEFGQHVQSVCDAIALSASNGIVHVAAAGNQSKRLDDNNTPADCAETLAISAFADFDGRPGGLAGSQSCGSNQDDSFANFSNFGPDVDIMAPGECVFSTFPTNHPAGSYERVSGTSMASAHVAGAVALYLWENGYPTNAVGAAAARQAMINEAISQRNSNYGLASTDDPDCRNGSESTCEPILYANAIAFGGSGPHGLAITGGPSGAPNPVDSGGQVTLNVDASDSLGHDLSYAWSASCPSLGASGGFDNANREDPTWTAPENKTGTQQSCTIQATVDDGTEGLSETASYSQEINSAPHTLVITGGPTGAPNPVASGGQVNLNVEAEDSFGHDLSYAWSASCPSLGASGDFNDASTKGPTWTAPVNATDKQQSCTIRVTVDDGAEGLSKTASYLQKVNTDQSPRQSLFGVYLLLLFD